MAVLGLATAIAVMRDLGILHFHLPENARLVPREVFYRGERRAALQFGFEMGTGLRTYLSATTPYVLLVGLLLLEPELPLTLLAGAGFGVGGATMLPARLLSVRRGQWDRRLDRELIWLVPLSTLVCGLSAWVLLGT